MEMGLSSSWEVTGGKSRSVFNKVDNSTAEWQQVECTCRNRIDKSTGWQTFEWANLLRLQTSVMNQKCHGSEFRYTRMLI